VTNFTQFPESLSELRRLETFVERLQTAQILKWSMSRTSSCKCLKCLRMPWKNAWRTPRSTPGHTCAPNDRMLWLIFWRSQVFWRLPSTSVRESCLRFRQRVMECRDCAIEPWSTTTQQKKCSQARSFDCQQWYPIEILLETLMYQLW